MRKVSSQDRMEASQPSQDQSASQQASDSMAGEEPGQSGAGGTAVQSGASTADRPAAAPPTSITGAASSQVAGGGGLDWLAVSCFGTWSKKTWPALLARLERAKQHSQSSDDVAWIEGPDRKRIFVAAAGVRHGPVLAEFSLEFEGMKIHVARNATDPTKLPNVFVQLGSVTLTQLGHREAWDRARRLLLDLGYQFERAIPSRVDLCSDLPGQSVEWYGQSLQEQRLLTRARHRAIYFDCTAYEGIQIGRDKICRIYDKVRECQFDLTKWAVLVAYRYGGQEPESAVRVEFQLRREEMRECWDITSVEDLFAKLPSLAKELTHEWLRFSAVPLDRDNKHQSRAETAPQWEQVQRQFAQAFGEASHPLKRPILKLPSADRLKKQIWGCLKTAMAVERFTAKVPAELMAKIQADLESVIGETWFEELADRRAMMDLRKPLFTDFSDYESDREAA
jgi:hypothetical protein